MLCCGNCGAPVIAGGAFCDKCGTRIEEGMLIQTPLVYAGFWRRVAASLIDGLIMWGVNTVLGMVIGAVLFGAIYSSGGAASGAAVGLLAMIYLSNIVVNWLYFALMESSARQATVGKLALGLKVTDADHNRISFGRATGRYFGKIVSGILLCIGFMMAGWTEKKQALHDMMASTLVVQK